MKKLNIVFIAISILTFSDLFGQSDTNKDKMIALSELEGDWSGGGWMITPSRERIEFSQKESINYELDGTILQIKGQGWNATGDRIHNAYAIMSYDMLLGQYVMNSFLEDGRQTKAEVEIMEDGQIKWWFNTPEGGTVKYLISINENIWHEKGRYSPDGANWFPFIEFELTKVTQ